MNNNDWNPNYGDKTQFAKKKHFKFDKDTNTITFRILPQPKGERFGTPTYDKTSWDSTWHRYISSIFGFKNSEGKFRIFESPLEKNNRTKMVDVPCAATDLINSLKGKLEEAKATNADPAVVSHLNQLVGMKGVYNVDTNQHMNVLLLDGSIGELKLRHKAFVALKAEIDKLRTEGVDPLSLENGRFFVMTRTINGRDTVFSASVYKEKIKIEGIGEVEKPYAHAVGEDVRKRLELEGFKLDSIFTKLTSDEVSQVVKEVDLSSGKSPACDRFFDLRWKAGRDAKKVQSSTSNEDDNQDNTDSPTEDSVLTQITQTADVTSVTASTTAATIIGSNVPPVTAQTAAKPPVVDELSDEAFFNAIGVKL